MKNLIPALIFPLCTLLFSACCNSYEGYGRYLLRADCDDVTINGHTYNLTIHDNDFVIDGHTITRGIYRKTEPWLYIHNIQNNSVDVTFEQGEKDEYPLYTGSSGSIFEVYTKPWEMTRSTCALISEDHWLISHRWSTEGIFFDLQLKMGNNLNWKLESADIFVPKDGSEVIINGTNTKVSIKEFDYDQKKAKVLFTTF